MQRKNISSGAPWEDKVAYSRAVKTGKQIWFSGTTAVDEKGAVIGLNDAAKQTRYIFEKIKAVLEDEGLSINNIVMNRIYVKNIDDWEAISKVHYHFFKDIKPACTLLEVSRLINDDLLVEIESIAQY